MKISNSQDDPPASPIDGSRTRPWYHVPGDHRRTASPERFDLYWDEANQFGMVHPRAKDPWETLIYYETEGEPYYTHSDPRSEENEKVSNPLYVRLLRKLAWMGDRGVVLSEHEVDRLCSRKPATILDIGCGRGKLLARCRDLGHAVYGVEPDIRPREAARAQGLDVYSGTCESLPDLIQAKTFDLIIASHVLHHCISPTVGLRNIADRLVPGGRLICEVPNQECLGARWSGIAWAHFDVPRQVNVFTLRSLSRMIEQSSLHVEAVRWAQYCRQFLWRTVKGERRKYDFFEGKGSRGISLPVKPTMLSRYALLACSLFAKPSLKYDAVRIIARKS
jgi:2-polyprenyl-3-methyl-5-hydroxy-6-metoxy-1,4-benzoquinol methylase